MSTVPTDDRLHSVQFYEEDAVLIHALAEYVGAGLHAGDRCLVVATGDHRTALDQRLAEAGLDLAAARQAGHYLTLDAADTLGAFMAGDAPDAARFDAVVGTVVARMADGHRLRVFGEMVGVLYAGGRIDAAIALEKLWNELGARQSFRLHCAYPMTLFRGGRHAEPFTEICGTHGHVVPADSYHRTGSESERLRTIARLQQQALSLAAAVTEREQVEETLRRREEELRRLNAKLAEKVAELSEKVQDLEMFHDVAVAREIRMMDLERENEALRVEMRQRSSGSAQTKAVPGGRSISSIS